MYPVTVTVLPVMIEKRVSAWLKDACRGACAVLYSLYPIDTWSQSGARGAEVDIAAMTGCAPV